MTIIEHIKASKGLDVNTVFKREREGTPSIAQNYRIFINKTGKFYSSSKHSENVRLDQLEPVLIKLFGTCQIKVLMYCSLIRA